jgi:hypothetical protein
VTPQIAKLIAGKSEKEAELVLHAFAHKEIEAGRGRVIVVDGSPYLSRVFLRAKDPDLGVFLHYFHKGDQVRDFHNHPWDWAYSWILCGGYSEERFEQNGDGKIIRCDWKRGDTNFLTKNTFHRVDLDPAVGCWTLFVRGPRSQGWGFFNRDTGAFSSMEADDSTND